MPKGKRTPEGIRQAVLRDYFEGIKPVEQIAAEYGIHRRRIYDWTRNETTRRPLNKRTDRKGLRISLDEAELMLLMIGEFEKIAKPEQRAPLRLLEDRILQIADDLWTVKHAATN